MIDGRSKTAGSSLFGLGLSARHVGQSTDAFPPFRALSTLGLRKTGFFGCPRHSHRLTADTARTNEFGNALWYGIFDASYTKPGIISLRQALRISWPRKRHCCRFYVPGQTGPFRSPDPTSKQISRGNTYGGYTVRRLDHVDGGLARQYTWRRPVEPFDLPTCQPTREPRTGMFLCHRPLGVVLSPGDIITDDLGRTAVISGSELTDLGWRIIARMATT